MMFQNKLFEALVKDMCVNLRRRDISMSQQLLNNPQIRTVLQEVRRKGMAQYMWRDIRRI